MPVKCLINKNSPDIINYYLYILLCTISFIIYAIITKNLNEHGLLVILQNTFEQVTNISTNNRTNMVESICNFFKHTLLKINEYNALYPNEKIKLISHYDKTLDYRIYDPYDFDWTQFIGSKNDDYVYQTIKNSSEYSMFGNRKLRKRKSR